MSANRDNESAYPVCKIVVVVATGTGASYIKGFAEVRGVEASIVYLVLSGSAVDFRGHALSVDNDVGSDFAGGAGTAGGIILVARRINWDTAAEVEVIT